MKTHLLSFGLLSLTIMTSAQDLKNTIKTNLTAYAFRNINLTYERSINKTFAVNVSYASIGKGDVPFLNTFIKEESRAEFKDIQFANSAFTIEGRVYFGEKYNSGFYLAPYYRYTKMKLDHFTYQFEYYNEETELYTELPLDMSGDISANSFGLMIGSQWVFGKNDNWVIDFWIIGGHYGFSTGDINGKSSRTMTADEQAALQDDLNNLDLPIVKYEAEVNANGGKIKVDGPWAGLRSGLSFGYRF